MVIQAKTRVFILVRAVRALVLLYSMSAVGVTNGREREPGSRVSGLCVRVCACVQLWIVGVDVEYPCEGYASPLL